MQICQVAYSLVTPDVPSVTDAATAHARCPTSRAPTTAALTRVNVVHHRHSAH